MEMQHDKLWFRAKRYGWGWVPCSWEGWASLAVYIIAIVYEFLSADIASHSVSDTLFNFIPGVLLFTVLLIALCFAKGEKPTWRWGDKDTK